MKKAKTGTNLRRSGQFVETIKARLRRNPNLARKFTRRIAKGRLDDLRSRWDQYRTLKDYDLFFNEIFNKPLVDVLADLPREKNGSLVVLDDGAGYAGNFLVELKLKLKAKGVSTKTIALSLNPSNKLKQEKERNEIDVLHSGPAEFFVPKEPVDAILSLYGSINYALDALSKPHLMKFASSLRKGGIMLVGFTPLQKVSLAFFSGIEKAFAKKGFQAEFRESKLNKGPGILPSYILYVKRIK